MKTLLLPGALALSAFALTAPPASAAITCWYNNSGAFTGLTHPALDRRHTRSVALF
jgi:hypothetical protein